MLALQDTGGKRLGCVALDDRDPALIDDLAGIDPFIDPMDTAAGLLITGVEGALMGIEARIFW